MKKINFIPDITPGSTVKVYGSKGQTAATGKVVRLEYAKRMSRIGGKPTEVLRQVAALEPCNPLPDGEIYDFYLDYDKIIMESF